MYLYSNNVKLCSNCRNIDSTHLRDELSPYERNKNIFLEGKESFEVRILSKVVKIFKRLKDIISSKTPVQYVLSERIVEYPLLFQYINKEDKTILDFGCVEDLLPIHLCSLGIKLQDSIFGLILLSILTFNSSKAIS